MLVGNLICVPFLANSVYERITLEKKHNEEGR